jgi:hypothetical protein
MRARRACACYGFCPWKVLSDKFMRFFRFFLKVPVLRESLLSPIDFRAFYTILHQKYREIPHAQEQNLDETGIISILWVNMGQLFLSFQVLRQVIADDIFLGKSHPKRFAAKPFFKATARRGPKANSQVGGRNVYSLI